MPALIFDIGVCNGDDSAYYLRRGYRVVGVEANPLLLPALRERFAAEAGEGRFELLGVGIAEAEGEAQFWVCDERPEWSSFDRSVAGRKGFAHHAVTVPTIRFGSLLERFGAPFFCKIDIEGKDILCLEEMSAGRRPDYLSVEHIQDEGERQVGLLQGLGYRRFKLISQLTLRQPGVRGASMKARLPHWLHRQVARVGSRVARHGRQGTWRFTRGSSGPFGEDTPGRWLSAGEVLELIAAINRTQPAIDWHDIHDAG